MLLKLSPTSLVERRLYGDGGNVVHLAAELGCASFLEHFLPSEDDRIGDSAKTAVAACLTRDAKGRTPLALAVASQSTASIAAIVRCLLLVVSDRFVTLDGAHQKGPHLGDLLPFDEIIELLGKFPAIGLDLVRNIKFVAAYDSLVKKGCDKAPLQDGSQVVLASSTRSPADFWQAQFSDPDPSYVAASDFLADNAVPRARRSSIVKRYFDNVQGDNGSGVPVSAKLVPLKDAAKSSAFLEAVVKAADETSNFAAFESELLVAVIDFKVC